MGVPVFLLAGKSAWDTAEGGLQGFTGRFSGNMNTAQYREIVEALGFDPAGIDQKTLCLAFDIANVVWEDEDTQAIITRFTRNLAAAQHSLEWANIAGGAAFEIVLTAILAALTAGAGATVALAGKGKYLRKLGELLRDLAEPLKRLKRRWGKGSRGKGADSGKKAVVEEVEAPGYNEPLKGAGAISPDPVKVESNDGGGEVPNTTKAPPRILTEDDYRRRVEFLEKHFGTSNVHSIEKHGAQTSGLAQYRRVKNSNYPNPATGAPGAPTKNASKFLTHKDHYHTLRRAIVEQKRSGFQIDVEVQYYRRMGVSIRNLGTHSNRGPFSAQYVDKAVVRFDPATKKFYTAFPKP